MTITTIMIMIMTTTMTTGMTTIMTTRQGIMHAAIRTKPAA